MLHFVAAKIFAIFNYVLVLLLLLPGDVPKVTATIVPEPFLLNISQARVNDLKLRLSLARYPPMSIYGHGRNELGLEATDLKIVIDYWINEFDWKLKETELNQFNQYIIEIEGVKLHYLHIKSSSVSEKPLLLLVHGWPSTSFDFKNIIPLLNEFDIIAPSLPGFPLSSMPTKAKFGYKEAAHLYTKLVRSLDYKSYVACGGDWGSMIVPEIAVLEEQYGTDNRLLGIHVNGILGLPAVSWNLLSMAYTGVSLMFPYFFFDSHDYAKLSFVKKSLGWEASYFYQHMTKPSTIGAALYNSPVSLAAWLVEKYITWTDSTPRPTTGEDIDINDKLNISLHRLENSLSLEDIATTLSLYWFTDTIDSSIMIYYNSILGNPFQLVNDLMQRKIYTTPVAIADFPMDILWSPLSWARHRYRNIVRYTRFDKGGHFAAMEVPEALATDILAFLELLKTNGTWPLQPSSFNVDSTKTEEEL